MKKEKHPVYRLILGGLILMLLLGTALLVMALIQGPEAFLAPQTLRV